VGGGASMRGVAMRCDEGSRAGEEKGGGSAAVTQGKVIVLPLADEPLAGEWSVMGGERC